jgi:PST family polysaccharide transporter
VAVYSLGDKIIRTTLGMIDPFTQAMYPTAYKKLTVNKQAGIYFVARIAVISLTVLAFLGSIYWYFAASIIQMLAGQAIPAIVSILRLHAFLPCIVILCNIVGIGILLPLQVGYKYTLTMLSAGILCAGLHFALVPIWQAQGAAWAIIFTEAFATTMMLFWAYKQYKAQI